MQPTVPCLQMAIDQTIRAEPLSAAFANFDNVITCDEDEGHRQKNFSRFYAAGKKYRLTFHYSKSTIAVKLLGLSGHNLPHRPIKSDPDKFEPLLNLSFPKD